LKAALNALFNYAVKKEYKKTNPCKNCDLPQKDEKEKIILDFDEAKRFTEVCQTAKNGLVFELALETGMRPEEYLALRWRDVDFRNNAASVRQIVSFHRRAGGGFYFAEPKTKKSRRLIPISLDLRERLVEHRRRQNEHRLASKISYAPLDLVFANEAGNPYEMTNLIRRYFKPILRTLGFIVKGKNQKDEQVIKNITLYSLRHSCASILLMAGENPKVVSERLGHSSVVITLDTYSHILPTMQATATNKMDNVLRFKTA
jgi:integrase